MITRDRLLAGLNELVHVEEGMVALFANFSKALLKHSEGIGKEKKEKIDGLLSVLYRDSTRHRDILDRLAEAVAKGTKNEY